MSFKSWINDWCRYRTSRFPLRLYLPLAILICTAANVSAQSISTVRLALDFMLTCSLLFQFRLWDDLNDVQRDRVEHTQRVLSQATSLSHFRWLLVISLLINVGITSLTKPMSSLLVFLGLDALFFVSYQLRRALHRPCWFCFHGVLLKYPVFVYLVSPAMIGDDWVTLAYAMATIYFCFGVYEILHDQSLHAFQSATTLLGFEMVTLSVIVSLMLFRKSFIDGSAFFVQAIVALGSFGVLVMIFHRHRNHISPGRWCYIVFLLSFVWLLDCLVINSDSFQVMSKMRVPQ